MKIILNLLLLHSLQLMAMDEQDDVTQLMNTQEIDELYSQWLLNHEENESEKKIVFFCRECHSLFNSKKECAVHINMNHPSASKPLFICNMYGCDCVFVSPRNFIEHKLLHTKPLVCKQEGCRKTFTDRGQFVNHKNEHGQIKDTCSCRRCFKEFTRSDIALKHERDIHLYCYKHEPFQFASRDDMMDHEKFQHSRSARRMQSIKKGKFSVAQPIS